MLFLKVTKSHVLYPVTTGKSLGKDQFVRQNYFREVDYWYLVVNNLRPV